jgi:hypothetical protein
MKTPHPYEAFIAEWVKDTSRLIQHCRVNGNEWSAPYMIDWNRAYNEFRHDGLKFRFAPEKKKVVSSLSDEEISFASKRNYVMCGDLKAIANAAAQREQEDIIEWLKIEGWLGLSQALENK